MAFRALGAEAACTDFIEHTRQIIPGGGKISLDRQKISALLHASIHASGAIALPIKNQAEHVLSAFGHDTTEQARVLRYPYKRLWQWKLRGTVVQGWEQPLLDRAAELGIDLEPKDFVVHLEKPAPPPRKQPLAGNGEPHGSSSF